MEVPEFKSDIPKHLTGSLSKSEQWLYEQVSIQGQQNKWLIERTLQADVEQRVTAEKVSSLKKRIQVIENLKAILTAKGSVVLFLVGTLLFPIALALLSAWAYAFFEKWMNAKG